MKLYTDQTETPNLEFGIAADPAGRSYSDGFVSSRSVVFLDIHLLPLSLRLLRI